MQLVAGKFKNKFEDVIVLRSGPLAQAYTRQIDSLLPASVELPAIGPALRPDVFTFPGFHQEREKTGKRQVLQQPVTIVKPFSASVYFSPEHQGLGALIEEVERAEERVDMAMRWLIHAGFTERLARVAADGKVPVRLLVNRDELIGPFEQFINQVITAGGKVYSSRKKMNMHWKICLIDGREVWTGSANVTPRTESYDVEDMLRLDSPELTAAYQSAYDALVSRLADKSREFIGKTDKDNAH